MLAVEREGNVAAHGEAAEYHLAYTEGVQEGVEVVGQKLHCVRPGRGLRLTVAPQVRCDHAELAGKGLCLRLPHPLVQREPVQQHDRHVAASLVAIGNIDVVCAYGGHCVLPG